jgi:hypothetical protein
MWAVFLLDSLNNGQLVRKDEKANAKILKMSKRKS